ncbi:hypothetical protein [Nostoc sp. CCY0012]
MPETEKYFDLSGNYMDSDVLAFFASVGLLIIYLVFSALTEMGTKLPGKK